MKNLLKKLVEKILEKPLRKLARWAAEQNAAADAAREAEAGTGNQELGTMNSGGAAAGKDAGGMGVPASPSSEAGVSYPLAGSSSENPPPSSKYPLGLASCWNGDNASERMMNVLSPRMGDDTFKKRLAWMVGRGCTVAHVILVNGADGEAGGYAAWDDKDRPKMLERWQAVRDAGLALVPWIITDDSRAYRDKLFSDADKLVGKMSAFLAAACPCVVLGLEMDEDKSVTADQWKKVRDAVKKHYKGPLGVHHCSGGSFKFASLGDVILGQLDPGCTEAQVKAQVKAIRAKGKRAVGFEYARGPNRKLAQAALDAGAEGVGNW